MRADDSDEGEALIKAPTRTLARRDGARTPHTLGRTAFSLVAAVGAALGALALMRDPLRPGESLWAPLFPPLDARVSLSEARFKGVRFMPAGITPASTECPPFEMDPNRTTRAQMVQLSLGNAVARALRGAPPAAGASSWCQVSGCVHGPPARMLALSDVCLHNDTLYLLRPPSAARTTDDASAAGADGRALLLHEDWFGPSSNRSELRLFLREVPTFASVPAPARWLDGDWVLTTPRTRYGGENVFHALAEEVGWLGRAMACGQLAARAQNRYLPLNPAPILGPTPLGRLWELATDGGRTFVRRPAAAASTAFCFRRAHVEASGERNGEALAACARAGARASIPPRWPGWPEPTAAFRGVPELVERARGRLGLGAAPVAPAAAAGWRAARVTVIHRLRGRRMLNLGYLAEALRAAGHDVTVVALECMPIEAQLVVVANSSTLVGVHGAALGLGHALPHDALLIELRSAPCVEATHGGNFKMRRRYQLIPAPRNAVGPQLGCRPPPWRVNSRDVDAMVDVSAVLRAIRENDPIASFFLLK